MLKLPELYEERRTLQGVNETQMIKEIQAVESHIMDMEHQRYSKMDAQQLNLEKRKLLQTNDIFKRAILVAHVNSAIFTIMNASDTGNRKHFEHSQMTFEPTVPKKDSHEVLNFETFKKILGSSETNEIKLLPIREKSTPASARWQVHNFAEISASCHARAQQERIFMATFFSKIDKFQIAQK